MSYEVNANHVSILWFINSGPSLFLLCCNLSILGLLSACCSSGGFYFVNISEGVDRFKDAILQSSMLNCMTASQFSLWFCLAVHCVHDGCYRKPALRVCLVNGTGSHCWPLFERKGDQGSYWHQARMTIDQQGPFRVRLFGFPSWLQYLVQFYQSRVPWETRFL